MDFSDVNSEIARRFPELAVPLASLQKDFDPDEAGPYNVMDFVFSTYIELLFQAGDSADGTLHRVFAFVEDLVLSPDFKTKELGWIGIFNGHGEWWQNRARPFLGPGAQAYLDEHASELRDVPGSPPLPPICDPYLVSAAVGQVLRDAPDHST